MRHLVFQVLGKYVCGLITDWVTQGPFEQLHEKTNKVVFEHVQYKQSCTNTEDAQQAHDVRSTSMRRHVRRHDVASTSICALRMTSDRRRYDVILTSCARWVAGGWTFFIYFTIVYIVKKKALIITVKLICAFCFRKCEVLVFS